jgi:hypothetical protein
VIEQEQDIACHPALRLTMPCLSLRRVEMCEEAFEAVRHQEDFACAVSREPGRKYERWRLNREKFNEAIDGRQSDISPRTLYAD